MLRAAPGANGRDEASRDGDRPSASSLAPAVAGVFRRETPAKADWSGGIRREARSGPIRGRVLRRYIARIGHSLLMRVTGEVFSPRPGATTR
jgi:hypothetical protein